MLGGDGGGAVVGDVTIILMQAQGGAGLGAPEEVAAEVIVGEGTGHRVGAVGGRRRGRACDAREEQRAAEAGEEGETRRSVFYSWEEIYPAWRKDNKRQGQARQDARAAFFGDCRALRGSEAKIAARGVHNGGAFFRVVKSVLGSGNMGGYVKVK